MKRNTKILLATAIAVAFSAWFCVMSQPMPLKSQKITTWHMCLSNGVDGPIAVEEMDVATGKILQTLPVIHDSGTVKWLGSPITGDRFGGGPANGLRDQV
jgi:hypothetical protein